MLSDIAPSLIQFLYTLPSILIALTFHEFARGFIADRLGDPTARNLGKLTLNPLKHLDPIGTLCMILFHFGWTRPIPINSRNFKKPRRDMALVAISGPIMNLLLAFVGLLVFRILIATCGVKLITSNPLAYSNSVLTAALSFVSFFVSINASLAIFHLLPIPPLAGSRLLMLALPPRAHMWVAQNERYIALVLLVLLWIRALDKPLGFLINLVLNGMNFLIGLIPFL